MISGLVVTDEIYQTPVQLLKDKFGGTSLIINDHMTHLLNLKAVVSSSDVEHMRCLYDDIAMHVRNLEILGVNADSYWVLMHTALQRKFPTEFVLRCHQCNTVTENTTGSLDKRIQLLKSEVESRERCRQAFGKVSASDQAVSKRSAGGIPSGMALYSNADALECFFCK